MEKLYTSPPYNIDVRWIGLVFEGLWSIVFAEVYRLISKACEKHIQNEHKAPPDKLSEQTPPPSVHVSGVVEHTARGSNRLILRAKEYLHTFIHPELSMSWAQLLFLCEVLLAISKVLTLLALKYVSYTTSMVFKSSKTVGILLTSLMIGNTEHITIFRIMTVLLIVSGSITYSYAELEARKYTNTNVSTHPIMGYILMFASEIANGFSCTYQDISVARCKRETGKLIQTNVIQFVNGVCTLVAGLVMMYVYNTKKDVLLLLRIPSWVIRQNIASGLLSLGLIPIIYSLKLYGSLTVGIVSTTRKLITIILSMLMTNSTPTTKNWLGIGLSFTGLTISVLESRITKALGMNNSSKKSKKD